MAKRKRKRYSGKLNWKTIFSWAIILATFVIVTLFKGSDWSQWLPDLKNISIDTFSVNTVPKTSDVLVHYIDVGQGDSILIQSGNKNVLIDAGEYDKSEDVVAYLKSNNIKVIDMVFVSHPHSDHIGGMEEVLKRFEVKKVVMGDIDEDILPTSRVYLDFLRTIKNKDIETQFVNAGESYTLGEGKLEVLGPVRDYDDLNNESLVIKFTYQDMKFLFVGDQEKDAEEDLLKSGADVSANVLKIGHHGSSTSSSEKFLNQVGADIYVIEVGKDNSYNHPHTEVRKILTKFSKPVYRTDVNGTIVIGTDGKELKVYSEI